MVSASSLSVQFTFNVSNLCHQLAVPAFEFLNALCLFVNPALDCFRETSRACVVTPVLVLSNFVLEMHDLVGIVVDETVESIHQFSLMPSLSLVGLLTLIPCLATKFLELIPHLIAIFLAERLELLEQVRHLFGVREKALQVPLSYFPVI